MDKENHANCTEMARTRKYHIEQGILDPERQTPNVLSNLQFLSPIIIHGERKTFNDKMKFKYYLFTNRSLQNVFQGKFQYEEVKHTQENMRNK